MEKVLLLGSAFPNKRMDIIAVHPKMAFALHISFNLELRTIAQEIRRKTLFMTCFQITVINCAHISFQLTYLPGAIWSSSLTWTMLYKISFPYSNLISGCALCGNSLKYAFIIHCFWWFFMVFTVFVVFHGFCLVFHVITGFWRFSRFLVVSIQ